MQHETFVYKVWNYVFQRREEAEAFVKMVGYTSGNYPEITICRRTPNVEYIPVE